MMFVVILLIGMGWSLMKPFLSEHDKKIFLVVIPLQVLDNIALIIVEDSAPGSAGWFAWKDVFRVVDLICCGAVMIPIVWSIRHLREAAHVDGQGNISHPQTLRLVSTTHSLAHVCLFAWKNLLRVVDLICCGPSLSCGLCVRRRT